MLNKKRLIITVVVLILITIGVSVGNLFLPVKTEELGVKPIRLVNEDGTPNKSFVRLLSVKNHRLHCTGVVFSATMLVTARHCTDKKYEVRDRTNKPIGIIATRKAAAVSEDYAVYTGDFSSLGQSVIMTNTMELEDLVLSPSTASIVLCGYPEGGPLACSPVYNIMNNVNQGGFSLSGTGFLFPGMSGGPVIDLHSRKVIAVNQGAWRNLVYLAPLVELYSNLQL